MARPWVDISIGCVRAAGDGDAGLEQAATAIEVGHGIRLDVFQIALTPGVDEAGLGHDRQAPGRQFRQGFRRDQTTMLDTVARSAARHIQRRHGIGQLTIGDAVKRYRSALLAGRDDRRRQMVQIRQVVLIQKEFHRPYLKLAPLRRLQRTAAHQAKTLRQLAAAMRVRQ